MFIVTCPLHTPRSLFHHFSIISKHHLLSLILRNTKKQLKIQQNNQNPEHPKKNEKQHLPPFFHAVQSHRSRNHQTLTVGSSESELDSSAQSESTSSFAAWRWSWLDQPWDTFPSFLGLMTHMSWAIFHDFSWVVGVQRHFFYNRAITTPLQHLIHFYG